MLNCRILCNISGAIKSVIVFPNKNVFLLFIFTKHDGDGFRDQKCLEISYFFETV